MWKGATVVGATGVSTGIGVGITRELGMRWVAMLGYGAHCVWDQGICVRASW